MKERIVGGKGREARVAGKERKYTLLTHFCDTSIPRNSSVDSIAIQREDGLYLTRYNTV